MLAGSISICSHRTLSELGSVHLQEVVGHELLEVKGGFLGYTQVVQEVLIEAKLKVSLRDGF